MSLIHFDELEQETHNPSQNVAFFIISDIFQDKVLIKNSCYWEMKDNCASAGLASFLADMVTQTFFAPSHRLPLSAGFHERDFRYRRSIFITVFL